jgi:hypothetical protein
MSLSSSSLGPNLSIPSNAVKFLLAERNGDPFAYPDYKTCCDDIDRDPSPDTISRVWFSFPLGERKLLFKKIGREDCEKVSCIQRIFSLMSLKKTDNYLLLASKVTSKNGDKNLYAILDIFLRTHLQQKIERAKFIVDQLLRWSPFKRLYDEVIRSFPQLSVSFVEESRFGGEADCYKGQIYLGSYLSDEEALSTLVFELTNLRQASLANENDTAAFQGRSCEGFVKERERIEFEGSLMHHKIMQDAIQTGLSYRLDIFRNHENLSFEKYYEKIKHSSHTDYYRAYWNRIHGVIILNRLDRITNCLRYTIIVYVAFLVIRVLSKMYTDRD